MDDRIWQGGGGSQVMYKVDKRTRGKKVYNNELLKHKAFQHGPFQRIPLTKVGKRKVWGEISTGGG